MGDQLRGRHHSVSSTKQYEECPQAYHFGRILRAPPGDHWVKPWPWRQGSAVHKALEVAYLGHQSARPRAHMRDQTGAAVAALRQAWTDEGLSATGGDLDRAIEMTQTALERESCRPADILGVEHKFHTRTPDGTIVIGYADVVLADGSNTLRIRDHKITSNKLRGQDLIDDYQLNLYAWCARREWPWAERILGEHHYPPAATSVTVELTEAGMLDAVARLEAVAELVEEDRTWTPRPGAQCHGCAWRHICPAQEHSHEAMASIAGF